MTDPVPDRLRQAIGRDFELEEELGRGGMSIVYRARDPRLKRPVAVKVLPPELAHDPAVRTRFAREAHTAAQLSHPHIVPIYDVGERDGVSYLVMALVNGGNLAAALGRDPRQSIETARRLLCEVAEALDYAHQRGVIHRDIKPDNILIDRETGRAMVTDFGIARALEAGGRLTQTGVAVGTPTYMSPEQATGERAIDGRSDIYSLGVVAYQMLTGQVPFSAPNSMALLLKHVTETPRPIADLRPDAPRALRECIERAMAKSPDDRWPTAGAWRDALLSDEPPGTSWRRDRQPVRYTSPSPDQPRRDKPGRSGRVPERDTPAASANPVPELLDARSALLREPDHLAGLTPTQRDDLRLWHGRIPILDRIKAMRGYVLLTAATMIGALGLFVLGVEEEVPPLVLAPIIPIWMSVKAWRRGRSLRENGLKLRRVLLMPRTRWVLPPAPPEPPVPSLEKLASREILDGPFGSAIRSADADRTAILDIVRGLSKTDRAMLPDVEPTAHALIARMVNHAAMIDRLDRSIDPRLSEDLDLRIRAIQTEPESPERGRRAALLQRQRATVNEMIEQRATLAHQIESAALALGALRLDLIKYRSSGLPSALSDVSSATQEARALSRDIGSVLDAMAEMRDR